LYVSDLERSHHFYQDMCGLNLVFDEPGIEAKFYSNGNSHHDLALMQASGREHHGRDGHTQIAAHRGVVSGLNHLGFEMTSEAALVEALGRAADAGYAVDRTVDHQISRSAYAHDTDSNGLEFYADAEEDYLVTYERVRGELLTELWDPFLAPPSGRENFVHNPVPVSVESALLRPSRADHAALVVSDLDRAVHFYSAIAGLELLGGGSGTGAAVLGGRVGRPDLLLLEGNGREPGLHHIGFELSETIDVAATARRLEAAEVKVVSSFDSDDKRGIAIVDPDGLIVEFLCPRAGGYDLERATVCADLEFLI
jgi:catechol 2,3-dioxygenase